jgi:hypothetical protein
MDKSLTLEQQIRMIFTNDYDIYNSSGLAGGDGCGSGGRGWVGGGDGGRRKPFWQAFFMFTYSVRITIVVYCPSNFLRTSREHYRCS